MSLSRKHFKALADIITNARALATDDLVTQDPAHVAGYRQALAFMERDIADFCADHNPNFDRARFLAACEPKE